MAGGSSSTVISASSAETSLLFLRRPVLALLIAASSIAPSNAKDSFYADQARALKEPVGLPTRPWLLERNTRAGAVLISAAEYALAGLAAGNVALFAYQLGYWNFLVTTNNEWDPMLMTYAALLTHLIGIIALLFRFETASKSKKSGPSRRRFWLARVHLVASRLVGRLYGADPAGRVEHHLAIRVAFHEPGQCKRMHPPVLP
ncbi:hypothetical protein RB595_007924 [Gaeumannomyces hyphopodioides]